MMWDAIVVGAGPAGCTAATLLARHGLRVMLLEKSAAPPAKVCGEYLSPGCLPILEALGALAPLCAAGARPLSGMLIHTARGRTLRAVYPGDGGVPAHGLAIRRERLDPMLLDLAIRAGVEHAPSFQVGDLTWEGDRVVGISGRRRGGSTALRGRLIIGADGRNSVVARRLGAVKRRPRLDKVALVGYAAGVARAEDTGEIFLGPDRYCILNPVAPGLTNIGLVLNRREFPQGADPTGFLFEAGRSLTGLGDRLAGARPIAPARCLGPLAHQATRLTAPGALLIGDAAGFLDPFTGEGIHAALRSAALAVRHALPGLRAGREAHPDVREYAAAWRRERGAKWRLCNLFQHAIRRPALAEWLICRLLPRPRLTALLMAAAGDLVPAPALSPGAIAARLLVRGKGPLPLPDGCA